MPGVRGMLGTNGAAILPPVGLSGTHNDRAGFAGSGAAAAWLSKAHVRLILSDDPGGSEGPKGKEVGRPGATNVPNKSSKSGRNEVYVHPRAALPMLFVTSAMRYQLGGLEFSMLATSGYTPHVVEAPAARPSTLL